jgi:hypothetical protein
VHEHFARDHRAQLDDPLLLDELLETHLFEVEVDELLLFFGP